MAIRGKVWKFGDSVSTDSIISGKYKFKTIDLDELSKHALESLSPEFAQQVRPSDVIVGGEDFGCGSSREQAPLVLKQLGVGAIVAKSFARIFYRNCINVGLLALECKGISKTLKEGDVIELRLSEGVVATPKKKLATSPVPKSIADIIEKGGLINAVAARRQKSTGGAGRTG